MVDVCFRSEHFFSVFSLLCFKVMPQFLSSEEGKPAMYMSQVTVMCLSAHRFQHRGQAAQQRTELCPTALSVMPGHSAIALLLHNTGQKAAPLPLHTHKYIRTHLVKINMSVHHSAIHRLLVGRTA